MSKPFGSGSVIVQPSRGLWQASYLGQKVTYSEARFGAMAETLAHRALLRLQTLTLCPTICNSSCHGECWMLPGNWGSHWANCGSGC